WDDLVLKPVTSAGGRHRYRLQAGDLAAHESLFARLIQNEAMMIQPLMESVLEEGDVSLMVIDGQFTHAVRKRARTGEFRVQDDHGGSVHAYDPTPTQINFAERVVAACPERPLYARVDFVF